MPGDPRSAAEEPLLNGDNVELKIISFEVPTARILSKEGWPQVKDEVIETGRGPVVVGVQNPGRRSIMLTYHDIGMNHVSNFQTFFNYVDMRILMASFTIYHVNAPGQEEGSANFPDTYVYPTMDELAAQVEDVCKHYDILNFFGFGVGFGANVLARFAFTNPGKVDALCLVNGVSTTPGWIEWGFQKMNIRSLRASNALTAGLLDYLLWHHFGKNQETRNHDLVQVYKQYFTKHMNPRNLSLLLDTYISRSDLGIQREGTNRTLAMPCLLITGHYSPHVEDTVTLNSRLNPAKSDWLKLSDCGMPLEEQPAKVSEALRLFLQGSGYIPSLSARKLSRSRSMDSGGDVTPPTVTRALNTGPSHQAPLMSSSPIEEEPVVT